MSGARDHDEYDDGSSSELFDQIIQWQLPVFDVSDEEEEQRQKLRASLRTASTPSDLSLPKRNFFPRKTAKGITEFFPQKEVVFQNMRDLLCHLLRPKCKKPHGKVGDFILTRKAMRVWKLMEMCYQILWQNLAYVEGQLCNILCRDFFCYFPKESHVSKAINDLEELMQCSRYSLGIMGTKRGMVAGYLTIQVDQKENPVICGSGLELPKQLQVLQSMKMTRGKVDIRCIIVVQEEKTLKALVNCPMFKNVPVILVTTEGIPEFTTRFFLHRLITEFPEIPVFGLVDWSPSGLEVLCAYKYGNTGSTFERNKLACGDMEWLGLTYEHILELEEALKKLMRREQHDIFTHLFKPLKAKDMEIVTRFRSFRRGLDEDEKKELDIMEEKRCKASTGAVEACFLKQGSRLSAYVLSKVCTFSSNTRWLRKIEEAEEM